MSVGTTKPVAAVSLTDETRKAPANDTSTYVAIGDAAELVGGGTAYLSRNRKSVARWTSGQQQPPVFLTTEIGNMQQAVQYRAVGTALTSDIVPMTQVVDLYAKNGRLADLFAILTSDDYAADLALFVSDDSDFLSLLGNDDANDAPADIGAPEPDLSLA